MMKSYIVLTILIFFFLSSSSALAQETEVSTSPSRFNIKEGTILINDNLLYLSSNGQFQAFIPQNHHTKKVIDLPEELNSTNLGFATRPLTSAATTSSVKRPGQQSQIGQLTFRSERQPSLRVQNLLKQLNDLCPDCNNVNPVTNNPGGNIPGSPTNPTLTIPHGNTVILGQRGKNGVVTALEAEHDCYLTQWLVKESKELHQLLMQFSINDPELTKQILADQPKDCPRQLFDYRLQIVKQIAGSLGDQQ